MHVIYKYNKTVEFSELKVGDIFIYRGEPYLKLEEAYTSDEWKLNAFNFDICKMTFFDYSTLVMPVRADITIRI